MQSHNLLDASRHFKIASTLAKLLDNQFNFFGRKFGLDPLIGLIPFWGDLISLGISLYIIWIAWKLNVPKFQIIRMFVNVLFDTALGSIPLLGDITDFTFKANTRNFKILEKYVDQEVLT